MGDQHHRIDAKFSLGPEIDEIRPQCLGGQHVEGREWLVHQKNDRVHHQGARKANPLAHAAGEFAWIGGLKTIKANQVDRGHSFFAGLRFLHAKRVEPGHDIFENGEPGKQGEALEDDGDVFAGAGDGFSVPENFTG